MASAVIRSSTALINEYQASHIKAEVKAGGRVLRLRRYPAGDLAGKVLAQASAGLLWCRGPTTLLALCRLDAP
jgi:hypothetical protein